MTCKEVRQEVHAEFQRLVNEEVKRARPKHGPYNSAHEAYAVLLEEVDEFWDEVRKKRSQRDKRAMLEELVQVAAIAQMASDELNLIDLGFHRDFEGEDA